MENDKELDNSIVLNEPSDVALVSPSKEKIQGKHLGLNKDDIIEAIAIKEPEENWTHFAERMGCSATNIAQYRKQYAEEIVNVARAFMMTDVPQWFATLSEKAKEGDLKAIKLGLEVTGLITPPGKSKGTTQAEVLEFMAQLYATNQRVQERVLQIQEERIEELRQKRDQNLNQIHDSAVLSPPSELPRT